MKEAQYGQNSIIPFPPNIPVFVELGDIDKLSVILM